MKKREINDKNIDLIINDLHKYIRISNNVNVIYLSDFCRREYLYDEASIKFLTDVLFSRNIKLVDDIILNGEMYDDKYCEDIEYKKEIDSEVLNDFIDRKIIGYFLALRKKEYNVPDKYKDVQNNGYWVLSLYSILRYLFSCEEIEYTISYLASKGIIVSGEAVYLEKFDNYNCDCVEYREMFREKNNNYLNYKEQKVLFNELENLRVSGKSLDKQQMIKEKIFNNYLRMLEIEAIKYRKYLNRMNAKVGLDEIISYAYEGLWMAIDNYDVKSLTGFSSYANKYIKLYMYRGIIEEYVGSQYIVNVPYNRRFQFFDVYKFQNETEEAKYMSREEMGMFFQMGEDDLKIFLKFYNGNLEYDVEELIDESATFDDIDNGICFQELLNFVMKRLDERECSILSQRFGLNGYDPSTFDTIGRNIGLSKTRIEQIYYKSIEKVRKLKKISKN